ncbi:hypothetical protein SAMN02745219_02593 [Desulfofundulus thermosubterraneus DSM 16057]|uniref:site-specific DNA-methyltransferase (cytosine-N(4)-specific) n=1 Tax=Desulfofundulus thermosubterraneus DSM 16057 TaxID=1121432 RepID=A0A1M6JEW1_9FIRM|nr:hypothetical protein SAMN02745219_02593 [Desulfofundulus thermosubterraneus DSM 16057]
MRRKYEWPTMVRAGIVQIPGGVAGSIACIITHVAVRCNFSAGRVRKKNPPGFFFSEGFPVSHHRFIIGHVLEVLQSLPDESVHCVVTSPPYWGLRDYGLPMAEKIGTILPDTSPSKTTFPSWFVQVI